MSSENIMNRFEFESVVAGVLNLIHNPQNIDRFVKYIDPDYFYPNDANIEAKTLRAVLRIIIAECRSGNKESITYEVVLNELGLKNGENQIGDKYKEVFAKWRGQTSIWNKVQDSGILEIFSKYLKISQIAKISKDFSEKYQKGDIENAAKVMQETITNVQSIDKPISDSFEGDDLLNFLQTQEDRFDSMALSLAPCFDDYIGKFQPQTLNLIIAVTNGGKSSFAHHILRKCIEQKKHVYIACTEDRKASFVYRITAALTGIPMKTLKEINKIGMTSEQEAKIKKAAKDMQEYLKVEFIYGQTVDMIHKLALDYDMERTIQKKPVPNVHIVDYTGHIAQGSFGEKTFEKMRNAYAARKDFALKHNKICFDFAQVNRLGNKGMKEDKILDQSDLAGSYDLAQVCDNIISLNRNSLDITDGRMKFHVCKARDGEVGYTFSVKSNLSCARFDMDDFRWEKAPQSLQEKTKKQREGNNV